MKKIFLIFAILFFESNLAFAQSSSASRAAISEGFADIVEKLLPSVVNISTTQKTEEDNITQVLQKLPEDKVFDQLKEALKKQQSPKQKQSSLGSGFVISSDGYIVTKNHVIENAIEIFVNLNDGKKYTAKVIGVDKKTDLALLKINSEFALQPVKFGDSNKSRIGDWIIVVGNPFGLGGSVSVGIISARGRDVIAGQGDFLQTDAAINRGNSGGPLFNMKGEVIGIATAIFSTSGGNIGIGFAGTSNDSLAIIEQLKNKGSVTRGWLGVVTQDVSEEVAKALMVDKKGALVIENVKNSPAEKFRINPSDIIISFDNNEVIDTKSLNQIVTKTAVGKRVKIVVIRNGREKMIYAKIQKMPSDLYDKKKEENKVEVNKKPLTKTNVLTMKLVDLNKESRAEYKIDDREGVLVVELEIGKKAANSGLEAGDIILYANQTSVNSSESLKQLLSKEIDNKRESVLFLIKRKDQKLSIIFNLKD